MARSSQRGAELMDLLHDRIGNDTDTTTTTHSLMPGRQAGADDGRSSSDWMAG